MLSGAYQRKMEACDYPFDETILVINNGVPEIATGALCRLSDFTVTADTLKETFTRQIGFEPNMYALGELSAIWVLPKQIQYLCYVQGDCITEGGDWITPGIKILESEPDVMVVSPASEVNTWHDASGYDNYMSDQAFLIRLNDFCDKSFPRLREEVFTVEGTDHNYPDYGGNSFEAMVGKYLKKTGKKRKILTEFWTLHPAY